MISAYVITLFLFGMVLSYLWLIHHFWLRHVFTEDRKPAVHTRIVILGGGFGGLYSALHFDKTIAADPTVEVTLVNSPTASRIRSYRGPPAFTAGALTAA